MVCVCVCVCVCIYMFVKQTYIEFTNSKPKILVNDTINTTYYKYKIHSII